MFFVFPGPMVLQTKKGKPLLQINEFRYNCKRTMGLKTYWVCNKAPQGCKVTIVTYDDVIVQTKNVHNHF